MEELEFNLHPILTDPWVAVECRFEGNSGCAEENRHRVNFRRLDEWGYRTGGIGDFVNVTDFHEGFYRELAKLALTASLVCVHFSLARAARAVWDIQRDRQDTVLAIVFMVLALVRRCVC